MTPCPCGCGLSPNPGKRWIHGHTFKAINATVSRVERQERGRKGATKHSTAHWSAQGAMGGRPSKIERWGPMLATWVTQGPREAIRLAYAAGYSAGAKELKREKTTYDDLARVDGRGLSVGFGTAGTERR